MLKKSLKPKIEKLLSEKFEEEAFNSLFVIDVTTNEKSNFIRVYIDGDAGVRFSDCQKISRFLESYLDEDEEVGEKYTLEVSSPGVKRPLENIRQYAQHVGRIFKVKSDDTQRELKLTKVEGMNLIFETVPPKKKKKNFEIEIIKIAIDRIQEAIVKISFN